MSRRAEAAADTWDRIVDALLVRFASLPYDRIRLEDVAADAGVSLQTVLRRFGSKPGLLTAMAERELARIAETREHHRGAASRQGGGRTGHPLRALRGPDPQGLRRVGAGRGAGRVARNGRTYHLRWCEEAFAAALDQLGDEPLRRRRRAQLVALCDATTWRILRRDAGLEPAEIETALLELILPLVRTA